MKTTAFRLPGIVALLLLATCPALPARAAAANDAFAQREPIEGTDVTLVIPTLDGTVEPGEPNPLAPGVTRRSLWWTWTAPADGWLKVRFDYVYANASFLVIYRGDSLSALARLNPSVDYNYDTGFTPVQAGVSYQIAAVGDLALANGGATLHLWFHPPPANDAFADRVAFEGETFSVRGSTVGATSEPGEPGGDAAYGRASVWYSWTVPADGMAILSFSSPLAGSVDIRDVFEGNDLANLARLGLDRVLLTSFPAQAGHTYQLAVVASTNLLFQESFELRGSLSRVRIVSPANGAVLAGPGDVMLRLADVPTTPLQNWQTLNDSQGDSRSFNFTQLPTEILVTNVIGGRHTWTLTGWEATRGWFITPPVEFRVTLPYDDFTDRGQLAGEEFVIAGDTRGATVEPGEPGSNPSLWYVWTAPANGQLLAQGVRDLPDSEIDLFTGDQLANLQQNAPLFDNHWSRRVFAVDAGVTYQVRVGTTYYLQGDLFRCRLARPLINDAFSERLPLLTNDLEVLIPIGLASVEPGETNLTPWIDPPASAWYAFTPERSGRLDVLANGQVNVFTGDRLESLQKIGSSDQPIPLEGGRTYAIAVIGQRFQQTDSLFRFHFRPRPANDDFVSAELLADLAGERISTCALATGEPGEPGATATTASVWYRFVPPEDGHLLLFATNLAAPTWATQLPGLRVFQGSPVEALTEVTNVHVSECTGGGGGTPKTTLVLVPVRAGLPCSIQVTAANAADYPAFWLSYEFIPNPANDAFAARTRLEAPPTEWTASTFGATQEPGEPAYSAEDPRTRSVWSEWTAPKDGWLRVDWRSLIGKWDSAVVVCEGDLLAGLRRVGGERSGRTDLADFLADFGRGFADSRFPRGTSFWSPVQGGRSYVILVASGIDPERPACGSGDLLRVAIDFTTFTLTAPDHGRIFEPGEPVRLAVGSADQPVDGQLLTGEYWLLRTGGPWWNYSVQSNLTTLPSEWALNNLSAGEYTAGAIATNELGLRRHTPVVSFAVRPANDHFAQRERLTGPSVYASGTLGGASLESGEPFHFASGGPASVWYAWTAPGDGLVTITGRGFDWAPPLVIYEGSELAGLTKQAVSVVSGMWNQGQTARFAVRAGHDYAIVAVPWDGMGTQDFVLELAHEPTGLPFEVRMLTVDAGTLTLGLSGLGQHAAIVESSADLESWRVEREGVVGEGLIEIELPANPAEPRRFYRARID